MNETHAISRRSFLHGLPVAIAAGAIPLTASAVVASQLPTLIANHMAAWKRLTEAGRHDSEVEQAAGLKEPSVVLGYWHHTGRPILAFTKAEIERHGGGNPFFSDSWRTKKLHELHLARRRYRAACQRAGVTAAHAAYCVAFADEERTRLDLVLWRPTEATDADMKRRYMHRAEAFTERWCEDEQFSARMIARLSEVV